MAAPTVAEGDDEELGALEDAFDLQAEEVVGAFPDCRRGPIAFFGDEAVDPATQPDVGDADEPPGLHQSDARGGVCGPQQPVQDVIGHRRSHHEAAHVAAFLDGPVHRPSLVGAECVLAHGGQRTFMGVRSDVLVTASELRQLISSPAPPVILDVRWQLTQPDGRADYAAGHVPGAVYVALEDELTNHGVAGRGRHPLPAGLALQAAARRWGVSTGRAIVVYDDWNRAGSARAWWVLKAAGLDDVRILDGGLAAWTASGAVLETGAVAPRPGDVTVDHDDLYAGGMPTASADDAAGLGDRLADARAPERFRGEVEPVDPVAGHVPGAVNVPSTSLLAADGTFLADDDLAGALAGVAGAYCGSGVTASLLVAGAAVIGADVALFPGSWSQWSAEPGRPIASGD